MFLTGHMRRFQLPFFHFQFSFTFSDLSAAFSRISFVDGNAGFPNELSTPYSIMKELCYMILKQRPPYSLWIESHGTFAFWLTHFEGKFLSTIVSSPVITWAA